MLHTQLNISNCAEGVRAMFLYNFDPEGKSKRDLLVCVTTYQLQKLISGDEDAY
jgi:hypothetical protein